MAQNQSHSMTQMGLRILAVVLSGAVFGGSYPTHVTILASLGRILTHDLGT